LAYDQVFADNCMQ